MDKVDRLQRNLIETDKSLIELKLVIAALLSELDRDTLTEMANKLSNPDITTIMAEEGPIHASHLDTARRRAALMVRGFSSLGDPPSDERPPGRSSQ